MKYLLLVCWDAENMNAQVEPDPADTPEEEGFPWLDDLQARDKWVIGDQLSPPRRGRTVRVRDGKTIVTDGPFAETKERLGGYYLVNADSIEEAAALAAKIPSARLGGSVEVRQVLEM
jgi:hypothetical protein